MIKKYERVKRVTVYFQFELILSMTVFCLLSCKVYPPTYYFKDIKQDTIIKGVSPVTVEIPIQKSDVLSIVISSLNPSEDALYNKAVSIGQNLVGYLVENDGSIYLHKLGKVAVIGLTRGGLKQKLENDLSPYLKEPIVTVNFVNHRVTVFGDGKSTVITMPEEKISLLDVMAQSGAVSPNTQLNKVMVIREIGTAKQFKHLNLEDPSIFSSPWYYLQPGDIVVVKPNEAKIDTDQKRLRNQLMYTTIISGISFVFLIVDRIFR